MLANESVQVINELIFGDLVPNSKRYGRNYEIATHAAAAAEMGT